jgi:hypothetical protein
VAAKTTSAVLYVRARVVGMMELSWSAVFVLLAAVGYATGL